MHTCRCIFPLFLGSVYTTIAGLFSDKTPSDEGSKHFPGRIKESQSFIWNTFKTYKELLFCSCYCCVYICIYTYIRLFFDVCFDWFIFVFLFTVQVSKVMGVQASWKMLCFCACLPQWSSSYSPDVHWCVFSLLSLPSRRDSLSVLNLYPSPSPKCAVTCLSVTPLQSSCLSLFHVLQVRNGGLSRCQLCISLSPEHLWHRLSLHCVQRLCRHSFICNKTMQLPGQALPLVDVWLSFLSVKI